MSVRSGVVLRLLVDLDFLSVIGLFLKRTIREPRGGASCIAKEMVASFRMSWGEVKDSLEKPGLMKNKM